MPSQNIISYGQIDKIALPDAWVKVDASAPMSSFSCEYYHPHNYKDTRLYLMGHNPPLDDITGNGLLKLIKMAAHDITFSDFEAISLILRGAEKTENFLLKSVMPKNHNGKDVLIIEGLWKERKYDTFWVLIPVIDNEHNSVFLQEFIYSSPSNLYQEFFNNAIQSFDSIKWR